MYFISLLIFFFIYSILAWIGDTMFRTYQARKFKEGSFFHLPLCPVYGFGALIVIYVHKWFLGDWPLLIQGVVYGIVLAALEYVSGKGVLIIFHRRLWRYTNTFLNIDEFTDFPRAVTWGVLGMLIIVYIQPFLTALLHLQAL